MGVPSQQKHSDTVRQAKAAIEEHLQELATEMAQGKSERLVRYLDFCAQFHRYSFGNLMLALCQRPDLTFIAGLRRWNQLGRRVKPGEKGIVILAPLPVTRRRKATAPSADTADGQPVEEERILLFKPVYVFDVSQTEGEEVPTLISARGDATTCLPQLEQAIRAGGIQVEYVEHIVGHPGAQGVSLGGTIQVLHNLEAAEGFRVLAHEFAHELLHKTAERESKAIRETEADAVAYVVCRHFGIVCDTADYLLLHDSNSQLLLTRLETVRRAAGHIIGLLAGEEEADAVY